MINKLGVKVIAIKKEKFFEIINEVSESKGLNEDNLLQKMKDELYEVEKKLPKEDRGEYNKFKNDLWKDHLFSIKTSEEIAEDWTLLHLAVACNNVQIVELLLEKKVSVNTQVKDGSSDGPTALHIAASHGHQEIAQLLLNNNANPSLKDSQGRTPRDIVGNVEGKKAIIEMLEAAEESYRIKPKEKAKDLNIKIERGGHYRLLQYSHGTPAKTVKKRSNVTTALESGNKRSSFDESSDSTVDEQSCVSVKSMVEKIESPQKINATCSGKQTSISLNESSSSDDSGICTESEGEEGIDAKNEELKKLEKELAESKSCIAEHETKLKEFNKENESLAQKIQELGNENATLNSELEKTQKELAESKSYIVGHETKLKQFNKENESLKQKIKNLESENATLNGELGKTKTKTNEVSLEKVGKRQFSPKVAYASLAAMLAVGAALSIASGLSALLIVAASVVSALIAGGITYTISKPIAPDTELKEVDIQGSAQHGVCKTSLASA